MTVEVTAFYFGPPERPLCGWLHVPSADTLSDTGILVCNPLGYDALCLHRTQRSIATAAASRGMPALRFDYDGKGDSAGTDSDPERLGAWIHSVQLAVSELQQLTGVSRVCVFGVRMGATLALLAARESPAITAVIAVNPVSDGRRYLRELRAMAVTSSQVMADDPADPSGIQDFSGLVMTRATRDAISAIKLDGDETRGAPARLLLVERTDLPANDALARRLEAQGCDVQRKAFAGYGDMLRSAHESVVPHDDIRQWLDWVSHAPASGPAPRIPNSYCSSCRIAWQAADGVTLLEETVLRLDPPSRIFGVLTRPAARSANPGRVLLLLNSGAIHHIGPHRIYVRAARECAARGVAVLRFDLPGLGDSPVLAGHEDNATYPDDAVQMIRPVLDYLRREVGVSEVDCAGICSGAYHALKLAAAGEPLRQVTVINPLTFFWKPHLPLSPPEFQDVANMQRYRRKGLSREAWIRLLKGEVHVGKIIGVLLRRWSRKALLSLRELARLLGIRLQDDLAAELRDIARRGTRIHFIFADRDPGGQMLRDEGGYTVGRIARTGRLDVQTIVNADHTFTSWRNQQVLVNRIVELTTGGTVSR